MYVRHPLPLLSSESVLPRTAGIFYEFFWLPSDSTDIRAGRPALPSMALCRDSMRHWNSHSLHCTRSSSRWFVTQFGLLFHSLEFVCSVGPTLTYQCSSPASAASGLAHGFSCVVLMTMATCRRLWRQSRYIRQRGSKERVGEREIENEKENEKERENEKEIPWTKIRVISSCLSRLLFLATTLSQLW